MQQDRATDATVKGGRLTSDDLTSQSTGAAGAERAAATAAGPGSAVCWPESAASASRSPAGWIRRCCWPSRSARWARTGWSRFWGCRRVWPPTNARPPIEVAGVIGARLVEVATHEGDRPEYRANGPDRCFHCKDELFTRIGDEVASVHRLDAIAYGENSDDAVRPDRPGARAAVDHRVLRPLADAGLDKAAVRRIARALVPAFRRQARRAVPGLPDPALPGGDTGEAAADRTGRGGTAPARLRRSAGAAPRGDRPHRVAPGRICCAPSVSRCARRSWPRCGRRVSVSRQSISPVCSQVRSPCRWCRCPHG